MPRAGSARPIPKLLRAFSVQLRPADHSYYHDTALSDTKTIMRHWTLVGLVAVITLAASVLGSLETDASPLVKAMLSTLGAGVGTIIVLGPIVYLAALAAAPLRQRNRARAALAERDEAVAEFTRRRDADESAKSVNSELPLVAQLELLRKEGRAYAGRFGVQLVWSAPESSRLPSSGITAFTGRSLGQSDQIWRTDGLKIPVAS